MRGFAVLLAYVVGLSAVIGIGIIGVMALQSSIKPTPSAASVAATSQKERLAKPIKQTTVPQKDAQPSQRKHLSFADRQCGDVLKGKPLIQIGPAGRGQTRCIPFVRLGYHYRSPRTLTRDRAVIVIGSRDDSGQEVERQKQRQDDEPACHAAACPTGLRVARARQKNHNHDDYKGRVTTPSTEAPPCRLDLSVNGLLTIRAPQQTDC
jgi:hypothetical protein